MTGTAARTLIFFVGLVALVLGGRGTATAQLAFELPSQPMSGGDAAALPRPPALGAAKLRKNSAPGYLYGVWDPQRGVHRAGYGLADVAAKTAPSVGQSFRIGSVTKTFVATAVLLLVDDGKVKLDRPVPHYVGALVAGLPHGRTATVRQLLGMTSGIPDYANSPAGPFGRMVLHPKKVWTAAELVAGSSNEKPTKPGVVYYSNTNYIVLGELVRRVSGRSLGAFVKARILDPLGLAHTTIPSPRTTAPVTTHGYMNASWADFQTRAPRRVLAAVKPGQDVSVWSTSVGGAAGDGVSTLDDLARWGAADFGNVLLSPKTRAARLRMKKADNVFPKSTYGLGLEGIEGWHFHGGEIFGWETIVMANPELRKVVIVNANACCGNVFNVLSQAADTFPTDLKTFKKIIDQNKPPG